MAAVAAGVLAAGAFTLVSSAGASPSSATTMGMHGMHAAAGHVGYGYMLTDFTADAQGRIVNPVRTVTGVTSPVPATGWYLNLHQGTSADIVANGQPTVNFRPLLCADL